MPDLTDQLRQSVDAELAVFEPSAGLSQRIARRTLQLQRRRRGRVVGGAAVFAVAMLAVPLLLDSINGNSNAVTVGWTPVNVTQGKAKVTTTTTTTKPTNLWQLPDLAGLAELSAKQHQLALKRYAAALKKQHAHDGDPGNDGADTQVLDANISRSPSKTNPAKGSTTTTRKGTTTTTKGSTTTTRPPSTTTTVSPPTTTTTTMPIVPLRIVAPDHVCAGIPTGFVAVGTGADLVVWSNGQVGAVAVYLLTDSATISARLEAGGTNNTVSYGVQVIPAGTPPC